MSVHQVGYECEDSGVFEIDLKLPNGTVKPNFNFVTCHTVQEEKLRILKQENIAINADKLVMVRHSPHGEQIILDNSSRMETFDLEDCSLIELELESKAKEYDGRKPKEENLNFNLKKTC